MGAQKVNRGHEITRDYLMAFWLSPEVSNQELIISSKALAQELIMVEGP